MSMENDLMKKTLHQIEAHAKTLKKVEELFEKADKKPPDQSIQLDSLDDIRMADIQSKVEQCIAQLELVGEIPLKIKRFIKNYLDSALLGVGEYFDKEER